MESHHEPHPALRHPRHGRLHGRLRSLHTSPLQRCVHTAEVFARVAGDTPPIVTDRMLGDPGAWVLDRALAGENWKRLGSEGIMEQLATTDEDLPGTRPARVGAQNLACLFRMR